MTNKEAMKNIVTAEDIILGHFKPKKVDDVRNILLALAMGQEALLKQIPKKPTDNVFSCPRCNDYDLRKNAKYCERCGQAIDWSEDDIR